MQSAQKGYLFLLLVIGLTALSAFLYVKQPYQYGLDVKGGVRMTFRVQYDPDPQKAADQKARLPEIRKNLINVLGRRVSAALGVVEGNVQSKGEDEFIVEIPGFTDIETARRTISSTAKIYAYHAKNVVTKKADFRKFRAGESEMVGGVPIVTFTTRANPDKVLKPGDPLYKEMIQGWDVILEGDELKKASWRNEFNRTVPEFFFSASGADKMEKWSRRYSNDGEQLAFVLDNQVLSIAPLKEGTILKDEAFIDGDFTSDYVISLANLLNSGALPVSLAETSSTQVSPTIGQFALNQMVNAGLISFGVTVLFLLIWYVFPGFVALLALCLYVLFTLTVMKLAGATFSLAAIAGFILSVGMAVDANILVFERVKEELRSGKSLMTAVELGFKRAFPAILDSNVCTILTSTVLFFLGSGPVKGFASTLIIGMLISLFTALTVTRSLLVFLVGSGIGHDPKVFGLNRHWLGEEFEANAEAKPMRVMSKSNRYFMISLITMIPGMIFLAMGGIKPNVEFRGGVEAEFAQSASDTQTTAQITEKLEKAGFLSPIVKQTEANNQRILTVDWTAGEGQAIDEETRAQMMRSIGFAASALKYDVADKNVKLEVLQPTGNNATVDDVTKSLATGGFAGAKVTSRTENLRIVSMTIDESKELKDSKDPGSVVAQAAGLSTRPLSYSVVGPTIQQETLRNAYLGIAISAVLIVLWLAIRFGVAIGNFRKGLMFGMSAIIAMLHDIVVVVGIAAIVGYFANWQISTLFVTGMLTVIGFSVHDTIVIFDRIRENLHKPLSGEEFEHLCDRSVTQSFTRSINTSATVIITLLILTIWGTPTIDLKFFCITMLTGIVSGTYSSIFNATPILWLWDKSIGKKKGIEHTLIAEAVKEDARRRAQRAASTLTEEPTSSYGTVKRRRSVREQARQDIDE